MKTWVTTLFLFILWGLHPEPAEAVHPKTSSDEYRKQENASWSREPLPEIVPVESTVRRTVTDFTAGCTIRLLSADSSGQGEEGAVTVYVLNNGAPSMDWEPVSAAESAVLQMPALTIGVRHSLYGIAPASGTGNRVFRIETGTEKAAIRQLPSLPFGLSDMAATEDAGQIYLTGKTLSDTASVGLPLFCLDTQAPDKGWNLLTTIPATGWKNGLTVVQSDGFDNCLYCFYDSADYPSSASVKCYRYNLRLKTGTAIELPERFPSLSGRIVVPFGVNHVLLISGTEPALQIYHTLTNTIVDGTPPPFPLPDKIAIRQAGNEILLTDAESDSGGDTSLISLKFEKENRGFGWFDILVIILYFGSLAFIGFYFSKRQKSPDDYFKGGGRIPWWAAGLSLFGTALSAITFMAIPAKSYATDWSYLLFNAGIVLVAPVIMFLFIPYYRKLNITTAYEYLEARFNAAIRVICSLAFILFQVGRMGVVLFLPSIALNVVTGFDIFLCIALMGVFSIIYTMVGGIEAVVWTDALQVVILIGGALFALWYIAGDIPGGFREILSTASADTKFSLGDTAFNLKDSTMWTVLIAACFTHLTTYGTDQSMVQRYLTTSSQKEAQKSVGTNALLTIPATLIFFFIGTALFVFYKTYPQELSLTVDSNDAIFPLYIFNHLPAGVSGLLISGVFAAAMSTLSGSMNSAATAFVVDIRSKLIRRSTQKAELRAAKITTLVIGVLSLLFAFMMATWNITSLWDEFNKILGLILGSMGGLFILGMVTRRANAPGALIGIGVSILVQLFVARYQTFHLLLYTASGFVSCFAAGYLASLFFKPKQH